MLEMTVIHPSFHEKALTLNCLASWAKNEKAAGIIVEHVVIENGGDESYRKDVEAIGNIKWVNNKTTKIGSDANASAVRAGLEHTDTEWVFLCHADTAVTSLKFFEALETSVQDGYQLVGMSFDPSRIKAVHQSGLLTKTEIAKGLNMFPKREGNVVILDVCDRITEYVRNKNMSSIVFVNTFNNPSIEGRVPEPWRSIHNVDRVMYGNEVIYAHLGRGTVKTQGNYSKAGRVMVPEWIKFCKEHVL